MIDHQYYQYLALPLGSCGEHHLKHAYDQELLQTRFSQSLEK